MESADEEEISAEAESHLSAVCANVMRDVAILKSGLDISDISPQKRKKPFIARLTQLVQEFTCTSSNRALYVSRIPDKYLGRVVQSPIKLTQD